MTLNASEPKAELPAPQLSWRALALRTTGVFLIYALASHALVPAKNPQLNTSNPLLPLMFYTLVYLGVFLVVFVPIAVIPAFLLRKNIGFRAALNGMLFVVAFILAGSIYGGRYGLCRQNHTVAECR